MDDIRYLDLFGGIGGFRLGLQRASDRFKCVWYCDFDPDSKTQPQVQVYNKNFKEDWKPTDARRIDPDTLPEFDMLCAGFPCQSHSLAGKRTGLQDPRGELFFEIARIAKRRQPKLLLLENVFGLLSSEGGRAFTKILSTLDEVGYDAEWEVLDSKHYLVPQHRERVFIVGHSRKEPWKEVFPLGEGREVPDGTRPETQEGREWVRSIDSNYWRGGARQMIYDDYNGCVTEEVGTVRQTFGRESRNGVKIMSHSLRTQDPKGGGSGPLLSDEHSFTLDSSPHLVIETNQIRRITPLECERLQSFPDGWTEGPSDTQRYKMLGNAVTVNVIEAIGRKLLETVDS